MKTIDLRSDTVTVPNDEMRKAMAEAEVGDDVYGEDPTVNRLEALAAEITGLQAALLTTSGTQSNLIAVLSQTRHGNEIITGSLAHILMYEVGGSAALGGVVMRTVPNDSKGCLDLKDIEEAIRGVNIHYPETTLICLENTHNRCGGTVLTPEYTRSVCELAHSQGIKVHLDGARVFNAAVALGVPVSALTGDVDSVSFCLSKGLSAPVGSMLCGSRELIDKARKFRKMLGGGMRQAGVLAAAGIVALETMVDRLAEDHDNAKRLARGLAGIEAVTISPEDVVTNILMFSLDERIAEADFLSSLAASGVKINPRGGAVFRAVTHYGITAEDIDRAISIIGETCLRLLSGTGN